LEPRRDIGKDKYHSRRLGVVVEVVQSVWNAAKGIVAVMIKVVESVWKETKRLVRIDANQEGCCYDQSG